MLWESVDKDRKATEWWTVKIVLNAEAPRVYLSIGEECTSLYLSTAQKNAKPSVISNKILKSYIVS